MWSVVLLICMYGLAHGFSRVDPLVSTRSGLIRGLRIIGGYAQFLGIPYAEVDRTNPFGVRFLFVYYSNDSKLIKYVILLLMFLFKCFSFNSLNKKENYIYLFLYSRRFRTLASMMSLKHTNQTCVLKCPTTSRLEPWIASL